MKLKETSRTLKVLGHPIRLSIYKDIVKGGRTGISVGLIQEKLDIPHSTLSHHISTLCSSGIISQRRQGRTLFCVAEFAALNDAIQFINDECCIAEST